MRYIIKTFGCQQNSADTERIEAILQNRGMTKANNYTEANYVVINTCIVRQSAENRVYGLVNNLGKLKLQKNKKNQFFKIIVTGCMTGLAYKDRTGRYLQKIKKILPQVDEFMPIEEVGFDFAPVRQNNVSAWVAISQGCNNFCTYCVVPYTRGREISRPHEDIINECRELMSKGYKKITLLGQNVNSYGADIMKNSKLRPIFVKHLGRYRIPTLFPYLLNDVAKIGFEKVDFLSSNPWDLSDKLIEVIARNKNITRTMHLPVQSGDDNVLKRMHRWYSRNEYLNLVANLKFKIKNLKLTTDIIVGFCGETEEEFNNTVDLCKKVSFEKAYISIYSPRPETYASKTWEDDVSHAVKKRRWQILEKLINA